MAIAFDSVLQTVTHTPAPVSPVVDSFTNTAGTYMQVGICERGATTADRVTGVTYNGVSMTQVAKQDTTAANGYDYVYELVSPATGANNISVSFSVGVTDIRVGAVSYTGVSVASQANATGTVASSNSWTGTVTTVNADNWITGWVFNDVTDNAATAPSVQRSTTPNNDPGFLDSNQTFSVGSNSISGTIVGGGSGNIGWIVVVIGSAVASARQALTLLGVS